MDFPPQSKGKHVSRESADEPVLFSQDGVLESDDVAEGVLAEKLASGVDDTAVFVVITPQPCWIVVFQGEAKGIDSIVASGAIRVFAMNV